VETGGGRKWVALDVEKEEDANLFSEHRKGGGVPKIVLLEGGKATVYQGDRTKEDILRFLAGNEEASSEMSDEVDPMLDSSDSDATEMDSDTDLGSDSTEIESDTDLSSCEEEEEIDPDHVDSWIGETQWQEDENGVRSTVSPSEAEALRDLVLLMYGMFCPHCVSFKPTWNSVVEKGRRDTDFAAVDVEKEEDSHLFSEHRGGGVPKIVIVRNGKATEYSGGRSEQELLRHLVG